MSRSPVHLEHLQELQFLPRRCELRWDWESSEVWLCGWVFLIYGAPLPINQCVFPSLQICCISTRRGILTPNNCTVAAIWEEVVRCEFIVAERNGKICHGEARER